MIAKKKGPWNGISNTHIIKCYDMYLDKRISAKVLLSHFPRKTFKAIQQKVYRIEGGGRRKRKSEVDENQLKFPLGGRLKG